MSGFDNDVVYANNADFSRAGAGGGSAANGLQLDGQLWIGSTATNVGGTHVNVGRITSTGGSVTVTNGAGSINLEIAGGGKAIEQFTVDASTAPGSNPVVPNGSGNVTITGAQIAANSTANVIRTDSLAANTYTVEIQRSTTNATTSSSLNGVSHYFSGDFVADSNAFITINKNIINLPIGSTVNLGINYSSPTFKVTSSSGTALSASNPGYVVLPSNVSPGYKVVLTITADVSFVDDSGTSDIAGNTFGTTAGTAWNTAMPFYIFAAAKSDDTAATFFISRVPQIAVMPVAGKIAKSGSAVATTQGSMFAINSSITVANYASQACARIGCFRMAKTTAATDDWTVQALSANDGLGRSLHVVPFSFPVDQNGATSANLFSTVGGDTIPVFNLQGATYNLDENGRCQYVWGFDFPTASGVGTGLLRWALPLAIRYNATVCSFPGGFSFNSNATGLFSTYMLQVDSTVPTTYTEAILQGTGTAKITPAGITTDARKGGFMIDYLITTS